MNKPKAELWLFMNGEIKEVTRNEDGSFTDLENCRTYSRREFTDLVTNQCGTMVEEAPMKWKYGFKRRFSCSA